MVAVAMVAVTAVAAVTAVVAVRARRGGVGPYRPAVSGKPLGRTWLPVSGRRTPP